MKVASALRNVYFLTHGKNPNSEQEQPPLAHDTARTALLLNEARNATCSLTVEIHARAIR